MEYSLQDFRARTREAFNSAEAGDSVYIKRHRVLFELRKCVGVEATTPRQRKEASLDRKMSKKLNHDHMTDEQLEVADNLLREPRVEPLDE